MRQIRQANEIYINAPKLAAKMTSNKLMLLLLFTCTITLISPAVGYYHYQQQQPPNSPADLTSSQVQPQESLLSSQQLNSQVNQNINLNSNNDQEKYQQPVAHQGPMIRFLGSALNSTTIRLRWSLRNGYHFDYFDIFYGPMPDATHSFSVIKINGTSREYTFHNMQPDTEYQFEIRQHGDAMTGSGANGPKSQFKPQFAIVRTPPLNQASNRGLQDSINREIMPLGVKAEAKSNNSIQLSWTEPERPINFRNSNRVNIIRYYINPSLLNSQMQAALASAGGGANETIGITPQYHYLNVTNARDSKLIIQRLKPATEYAFAVKTAYYTPDMRKLYTQSGFSMDTVAKTFDLEPSAPKNFTIQVLPPSKNDSLSLRSVDLELNWMPPDSPNGQLKGYVILHTTDRNTADNKWDVIEANGNTTTNWYIQGLEPGHNYYFKVRAVNQKGQSPDSEIHSFFSPLLPPPVDKFNMPIPANNILLIIAICMLAILFVLALLVSKLACGSRRKPRKGSMNNNNNKNQQKSLANGALSSVQLGSGAPKLNGFATTNSSSTVAARVGTLARRRDQNNNNTSINGGGGKPDFWISAMEQQQQQADVKSNISEKSNSDLNMAMVSIRRDSPQFATTTQLAPALPEYRFASGAPVVDPQQQQLMQQLQQSHYHPGQFTGQLAFDQMDNATANALMTLSKRQQLQLQKYQIQFASTNGVPTSMASNFGTINTSMGTDQATGGLVAQAPSPHQQPPPPPPLSLEAQQQSLHGTHQSMANTRSLRLHRPTLYDPVSGSFVQSPNALNTSSGTDSSGPPNYNSHHHHNQVGGMMMSSTPTSFGNNTLQFHSHHHPHQTSTLLSRRSTNTLRSFQNSGGNQTYGQIGMNAGGVQSTFGNIQQQQQPLSGNQALGGQPPIMQSHQAVINQLNNSSYPSLPLKHVSAVRPQIMSSLEDQIEMELAEKDQQLNQQQQQQQAQPTLQSPGAIKQ